jgi:signal peptidase I
VSQELLNLAATSAETVPLLVEPLPKPSTLLRSIIETFVLMAIIFLMVNTAIGRFQIQGPSMQPNLHEGERVIVDKVTYWLRPPQRGDIIVFDGHGAVDLIKRIIALPDETIEIHGGQVSINGIVLDEPYLEHPTSSDVSAQQVAADHYYVMGDNRDNSQDSRAFGAITSKEIVGRAWIIYWPPTNWLIVPHYNYAAAQTH